MDFIPSDWSKINNITTIVPSMDMPTLADCPWPATDTHCSPCTIYRPDTYKQIFSIWGEYGGDTTRKRFMAQTACTDVTPIKRVVFKIGRAYSAPVPEGKGLFIGLVTADVLNDNAKLYDPTQWQWAGYLANLPGGTPVVQYWFCVEPNLSWTPTTPLYLLMVTNGSYNTVGWKMGGYYDANFPTGLPLLQYNYNEPGQPDGWSTFMDNRYKAAFHSYGSPGGQTIEGYSLIKNPDFPSTAQEGTPYEFSFAQTNENAFPCGCPETLLSQFWNRDTNEPIGNADSFDLPCGYTGVNFSGSFNFGGGNQPWVFKGRLVTGHMEGSTPVADDYYDFDVTVTPYPCSHWTTSTACFERGCYWWNGLCRTDPPTSCSQLNNKTDCETYECYWYDNKCNSSPQLQCSDYTTKQQCHSQNCWWWNNSCHDNYPSCSQLNNKTDCEDYGCYWYNNKCNSSPQPQCSDYTDYLSCIGAGCYWYNNACHDDPQTQPEICDWIDAKGGPTGLSITDVFEFIDAYLFQSPPPGYSFVPTVVQVFGVIDYYLGFNGDAATGCDYF